MTKIMTMPTKHNLQQVILYSDAILLGIETMCTNLPDSYSLEEIEDIIVKYPKVEVFVALNKNMHSNDLSLLKKLLLALETLPICGIFYYDIAIVQYHKSLSLHIPLVWSQEHLTTNYATMNYWYKENVEYTYVSSEITLDELLTIKKNTKMKLIIPLFGYLPMFVSKRHLVPNYLEYFKLGKIKERKYAIKKEENIYPIDSTKDGTVVYSAHILNGFLELKQLEEAGIDYITMNSYRIDDTVFSNIVKMYKERNYKADGEIETELPNIDKGFLYKETVYRVKNNEKK